jgi:hypothetical protein
MRGMTVETAEKLLAAFRTAPGRLAPAARAAGVCSDTAGHAWHKGLIVQGFPQYRRPFRELIAEEQEVARARLAGEQAEAARLAAEAEARRRGTTREKALEDVTQERVQEAQLVRAARGSTLILLHTVTNLSAGLDKLGGKVRAVLELEAAKPDDQVDVRLVLRLLGQLTTSLRQCNDAGQRALEMSRLLLGEPTSIVGHATVGPMTIAEARARAEALVRALDEAEAAGCTEIEGGTVGDPQLQ